MYLELKNLTKKFDNFIALDAIDLIIEHSPFLCIVGERGSGKSTLLRTIAGVYSPDDGDININENSIFSDLEYQTNIFFISDNPVFVKNETISNIIKIYKCFYKDFNVGFANEKMDLFFESKNIKITELSLEDRKILSIILGIASEAKYVLMDETFDNIENSKKELLYELIQNENRIRGLSLIFTTQDVNKVHNIATDIILLKAGRISAYKNLEEAGYNISKVQYLDKSLREPSEIFGSHKIIDIQKVGSVWTVLIGDNKNKIEEVLKDSNLDYYEFLKLDINDILYDLDEI
jgi:ABC-2 type transport system ATP-binding protein